MKNNYYHPKFYPKRYENYFWKNNHENPYDEFWDNEISNYSLISEENSEFSHPDSKFQIPEHISKGNITTQTYESDFNQLLNNKIIEQNSNKNGTNKSPSEHNSSQIQLNKKLNFAEKNKNLTKDTKLKSCDYEEDMKNVQDVDLEQKLDSQFHSSCLKKGNYKKNYNINWKTFPETSTRSNNILIKNISQCKCNQTSEDNHKNVSNQNEFVKPKLISENENKILDFSKLNLLENEPIRITISPRKKNNFLKPYQGNRNIISYRFNFNSLGLSKKALNGLVNYDFQYKCPECNHEEMYQPIKKTSHITFKCTKCRKNIILRISKKERNIFKKSSTLVINKIHGFPRPFSKTNRITKKQINKRPRNSHRIPMINNRVPHPKQVISAFERESQNGEMKRLLWALARLSIFDDGSRTFEIVEATPIPPGHYELPGINDLLVIGSKK